MNCPKCDHLQDDSNTECIRCGLIFAKYRIRDRSEQFSQVIQKKDGFVQSVFGYLLYIKPRIEHLDLYGRIFIFVFLFIWSGWFFLSPIENSYSIKSFMHLVNLPFHEAGHVIFSPFGDFVTSLGGSLGQILMPLVCLCVLLIKTRDTFGASIALWWLGENFIDMAPYINDARALQLPLLGGNTGASAPYGFHDWQYLLNESGLLQHDHLIAVLSFSAGVVLMATSFIWGGLVLYRQSKAL
jgi:hypothetical protein